MVAVLLQHAESIKLPISEDPTHPVALRRGNQTITIETAFV